MTATTTIPDPPPILARWGDVDYARLPGWYSQISPERYIQEAQRELEVNFLVKDLSIREGIALREAVQYSLKLVTANQAVIDRGEIGADRQINVTMEAVLRWLSSYLPGTMEHPIVEIFLGGSYYRANMHIWRQYVGELQRARDDNRFP